jgi:hypothetical protein
MCDHEPPRQKRNVRRRGTPVQVEAIRNKTPRQVRHAVNGFSPRYVEDWDAWVHAHRDDRPQLFGRILRKWQATRPFAMRRLRVEAKHGPPFLDDLLDSTVEPVRVLAGLTLLTFSRRTPEQDKALATLWTTFSRLSTSDEPSCVGISKATLLLTDGRIGPAFDSRVRSALGVPRPGTSREWLRVLEDVADDIAAFETSYGSLTKAVPARFAHLAHGRLYDMALGPRGPAEPKGRHAAQQRVRS